MKSHLVNAHKIAQEVAPLVGAWIEIFTRKPNGAEPETSLLSWERGLKSGMGVLQNKTGKSLLSWERGLKFNLILRVRSELVAPLVGAWIEINKIG